MYIKSAYLINSLETGSAMTQAQLSSLSSDAELALRKNNSRYIGIPTWAKNKVQFMFLLCVYLHVERAK